MFLVSSKNRKFCRGQISINNHNLHNSIPLTHVKQRLTKNKNKHQKSANNAIARVRFFIRIDSTNKRWHAPIFIPNYLFIFIQTDNLILWSGAWISCSRLIRVMSCLVAFSVCFHQFCVESTSILFSFVRLSVVPCRSACVCAAVRARSRPTRYITF